MLSADRMAVPVSNRRIPRSVTYVSSCCMDDPANHDARLRLAAFEHVKRTAATRGDVLESGDLARGFDVDGRRIPLINPRRGIFKPREMAWLLSVKTVFPKTGARVWYDDQREAHRQIYAGDETVEYAFMGADPTSPDIPKPETPQCRVMSGNHPTCSRCRNLLSVSILWR